jgi:hypothetical protein
MPPRRSARSAADSMEDTEPANSSATASAAATTGRTHSKSRAKSVEDLTEVTSSSQQSKRRRRVDADEDDADGADAAASDSQPAKRGRSKAAVSSAAAAAAAAASPEPELDGSLEENADDEDGAGEDAEAIAESLGMSLYEYNRQQNIRMKNEQLQMLNLQGVATEIGLKRAAPARSSSGRKPKRAPVEGFRRSLRSAGAPVDVYVPEMSSAGQSGWAQPERVSGPLAFDDTLAHSELSDADKAEMEAVLKTLQNSLKLSDASTQELASRALDGSYRKPRPISHTSCKMLGEGPKIINSRCTVLQFHPTASLNTNYSLLAAGDKKGYGQLQRQTLFGCELAVLHSSLSVILSCAVQCLLLATLTMFLNPPSLVQFRLLSLLLMSAV